MKRRNGEEMIKYSHEQSIIVDENEKKVSAWSLLPIWGHHHGNEYHEGNGLKMQVKDV